MTSKPYRSLIGQRELSIPESLDLRHRTSNLLVLKLVSNSDSSIICSHDFRIVKTEMAVLKTTLWSISEVQTFLSLVAEERIQRELDGAMRN